MASPFEFVAQVAGRLVGGTAMASPATRSAASLRKLSAIWDAYLRDAGAGDVGREHRVRTTGLFSTTDPRRDGVLLWLADHAAPALVESVATAVRAVGAKHRLGSDALDALAIALELMPAAPDRLSATATFDWLWTYVERLRRDPEFTETSGEGAEITLQNARLSTYRPADPGACWAANLALAARAPAGLMLVPPATLSRLLFRVDLDRDEQQQALSMSWLHGLELSDAELWAVARELERGAADLAGLSRNARGRHAWELIVGTNGLTRAQLTRVLGLSRGGAGVVVQQLVEVGLLESYRHDHLAPAASQNRVIGPLDDGLSDAASEVDQAMAEIDRLLARSTAAPAS